MRLGRRLQWPFDRAFPQAYSELNIVLDQVTHERMQCPEFLKCAQDQPDHMLDLGIRIIDDLAGGVVDIPNRQREAEYPGAPSARCPDPCVA